MTTEREAELAHHAIFGRFRCWEGHVEPGFSVNFLGVKTRVAFVSPSSSPRGEFVQTRLPSFDEEYFEWIDILEAVNAAQNTFTMIELGAGYGRWLANAAAGLRQIGSIPLRLMGVEAEPTHFLWMKQHFLDNGLNLAEHGLLRAVVGGKTSEDTSS